MSNFGPNTAYAKTYTVQTGTDIYAVFDDMVLTTSQGISYSITRQKAPVYTLGSVDPRAVARSKRGIAGSMIMTTFDRHCLGDFMVKSRYAAKLGTLETTQANPHKNREAGSPSASAVEGAVGTGDIPERTQDITPDSAASIRANLETPPMFSDQILPFDTTLSAKNEYNSGSSMRVFGLEVLNEGSGVSIDDTSNEVQLTYIARLLTPWVPEG